MLIPPEEAPMPTEPSKPRRIQRQRTKGWRMPEGAIYVGRPTRWGNPFVLEGDWIVWAAVALGCTGDAAGRRQAAVALYRAWMTRRAVKTLPIRKGGAIGFENRRTGTTYEVEADEHIRLLGARFLGLYEPPTIPKRPTLDALRGKHLACFCPLDQPCHADVLLELANAD